MSGWNAYRKEKLAERKALNDVLPVGQEKQKGSEMLKEIGHGYIDQSVDKVCARIIALAQKVNTSLQDLDLRNNGISHAGAQALAEALKVNTSL